MKIANSVLDSILKEIATKLNLAISKQDAINKKQTHYLALDYKAEFGGYKIINVDIDTGNYVGALGSTTVEPRLKGKVMLIRLKSILDGINAKELYK